MRLDLAEDPAVMYMAEQLDCREEDVVGRLHRVWSWASRQCHDGCVTNVTLASVGRVTNLTGFPELMRDAGWLIESQTEEGKPQIEFPKWESWMGQSAKKRLSDSKRQSKRRAKGSHAAVTKMSRTKRDKSVTTVQDRTGEESNTHTHTQKPGKLNAGLPDCLQRGGFPEAWFRWLDWIESTQPRPMDPIRQEQVLIGLANRGAEKAVRDIAFSIEKDAKSILDSDHDFQKQNQPKSQLEKKKINW